MAAKKTSKKPSKSDFIRQQPTTMSVADVIAKGKEAGLTFTSSLVYMVRGRQDGKATGKQAGAKKAGKRAVTTASRKAAETRPTAKKVASKTPALKQTLLNRANFVRSRGHLSPKEIVEDAKAKGIRLDPSYVYNVRANDKAMAGKKARASKKSTAETGSKKATAISGKSSLASKGARPSGSASPVEDLLKAAAAELGLGRAMEVLEGERARVRGVIGVMS